VIDSTYTDLLNRAGFTLNEQQLAAVRHRAGPLMVIAGPGSGKTRVITARTGMLLAAGIRPENIMVVTFTKAAAEEMKARVEELPDISLGQARRLNMGTFHGQFYRILRDQGVRISVPSDRQRRMWITSALRQMGEDIKDDLVESLLNEISLHKNNLLDLKDVGAASGLLRGVWSVYEAEKESLGMLDYDDMLTETHRLLLAKPDVLFALQQRLHYIMVDEFQDTNYAQYQILRLLASPQDNLCVVGDIDQAIYSWRGAQPEFLLRFAEHYPGCAEVLLESNHRSTPQIISLANRVIANNRLRHNKTGRPLRSDGDAPELVSPPDDRAEAHKVLAMVKHLAELGTPLHEMAVLYRINRYNHHLLNLLVKHEMPFVVRDKESSLEEHWVSREILSFFNLALKPDDIDSFATVARRSLSLGEDALRDVLSRVKHEAEPLWQAVTRHATRQKVAEFQLALRQAVKVPPAKALELYLTDLGYAAYLQWYATRRGLPKDEYTSLCDDLAGEMQEYKTLSEYLGHVDMLGRVMRDARRETGREGALNLMTLHGAKGLEFHSVWIIGCTEGLLPHLRAVTPEQLEEERRLFYVGCTRAAERLTVMSPQQIRQKKTENSRFVREAFGLKRTESRHTGKETKSSTIRWQDDEWCDKPNIHAKPAVGFRVIHSSLGEGIISSHMHEGYAALVTVDFPGGPRQMHWGLSLTMGMLKLK
jgi:DNA helicase II / ATP-dependent DNA helicase PcrA